MAGGGSGKVKETAYDKELAKIATERYGRYKQAFVPAENFLIDKATDLQGIQQQGLNRASVDYGAQFAQNQPALAQGLAASGAAPGSGKFTQGIAGYGLDRGQAMAAGRVDTANKAKDAVANNQQGLVAYGMGQGSEALQGIADISNIANKQAIMDSQAALASRRALGQLVGLGAGYGISNYYGGASNTGIYSSSNIPQGLQGGASAEQFRGM